MIYLNVESRSFVFNSITFYHIITFTRGQKQISSFLLSLFACCLRVDKDPVTCLSDWNTGVDATTEFHLAYSASVIMSPVTNASPAPSVRSSLPVKDTSASLSMPSSWMLSLSDLELPLDLFMLRKYWPHRCRPASFFSLFSLARLFWNQTWRVTKHGRCE